MCVWSNACARRHPAHSAHSSSLVVASAVCCCVGAGGVVTIVSLAAGSRGSCFTTGSGRGLCSDASSSSKAPFPFVPFVTTVWFSTGASTISTGFGGSGEDAATTTGAAAAAAVATPLLYGCGGTGDVATDATGCTCFALSMFGTQANTVISIFDFTSVMSSGRAYTRAPILRAIETAYLAFSRFSSGLPPSRTLS
uniref:Uncharacterized protein n=1 Tax=Anopheles atroparvus TaxID=41427 RepID=A0A182J8R2_ANOAO